MALSIFSSSQTHRVNATATTDPRSTQSGTGHHSALRIQRQYFASSGTQQLGALLLTRLVATAAADSTVALWNADEWTNAHVFSEFKYPSRSLGFSHDGEWLAAGGEDTEVHIVRFY